MRLAASPQVKQALKVMMASVHMQVTHACQVRTDRSCWADWQVVRLGACCRCKVRLMLCLLRLSRHRSTLRSTAARRT